MVDKGADVKLPIGTRVVVAFDIACGFCDFCKREEYTSCDTTNPSRVAGTRIVKLIVGFSFHTYASMLDRATIAAVFL